MNRISTCRFVFTVTTVTMTTVTIYISILPVTIYNHYYIVSHGYYKYKYNDSMKKYRVILTMLLVFCRIISGLKCTYYE